MILKSKTETVLLGLILAITTLSIAFSSTLAASEYKRHTNYNIVLPTTYITETTEATGLALSMGAAAIDCDTTSRKWQLGIGVGYYGTQTAPAMGMCKKFNGALFKATIGQEGNTTGGNFGVMFLLE